MEDADQPLIKQWLITILRWLIGWVRSGYFFLSLIGLLAAKQFLELTANVLLEDDITRYDRLIVRWLNLIHQVEPAMTPAMLLMTDLGGWIFIGCATIVIAAIFLFRRCWREALLLTGSVTGGVFLMLLLKSLLGRARPVVDSVIVEEIGYSLPSGHATAAVCFYGCLAYLAFRSSVSAWLTIILLALFLMIIAIIGLSRVYLGVHYPSDVMAGYSLGLFWLCFCAIMYKRARA